MNTHNKSLLSRERIKRAIEAFVKAEAEVNDPVEGKPVEESVNSKKLFNFLVKISRERPSASD